MNWNDYQNWCVGLIKYPTPLVRETSTECAWMYPALNLTGEAGEVTSKLSHVLRDDKGRINDEMKEELKKELGDVLWNVATLAYHLGFTLEEVMQGNISKLEDRKRRGVLYGQGDNR